MTWPTWEQITAIVTPLGLGFGWLVKRRDRIKRLEDDLKAVTEESGKAQRAHEEALAAKNDEISEWRRTVERLEDKLERRDSRIDELEDRLYAGRGPQ